MPTVWDKLDDGFSSVYSEFLRENAGGKLHVLIRYQGDPQKLAEAGFGMVWNDGESRATGALKMEDVERVAALPEVIRICYSRPHAPSLDKSIPDIKADQVWSLAAGAFSGTTGNGVLIGIIDTGIDFAHDFFMSSLEPKTTRILRMWDQGLVPVPGETSPGASLRHPGSPGDYGVEYTHSQINDFLRKTPGALRIRHRDCVGHGTHVASIAAGDGRTAFTHIGVAPKAELIIVKLFSPETEPAVDGGTVGFDQCFMDAVYFIRGLGAIQNKPFVINYSATSHLGPHDGLSENEIWLSNEFEPAASAGKIFVTGAGNAAGRRQHASIEFPAASTITVPFELYDDRGGNTQSYDTCKPKDNIETLSLHFYYPKGGPIISIAFQPNGAVAFRPGPELGGDLVSVGSEYRLLHSTDTDVQKDGSKVERELFVVEALPHRLTKQHYLGTCRVQLTAAAPVTVHVWCYQPAWHGFKLGAVLPAGVTADDHFLIGSPGGARNIVTVAAFDAERADLSVAHFSSRGPLVRYDAVGGAAPAKPDLAAPGVKIDAAKSRDIQPPLVGQLTPMNGTSMAAPHVTGVIALMLEKNRNLTSADVITILQGHLRTIPAPVADEIGAGRLDAKEAVDNTPP